MDIKKLVSILKEVAEVNKINDNEYEVVTQAKITSKNPIKIYLVNDNFSIKLVDKKNTLKYMNKIYELKSNDVKNCISAVIKLYGFMISSGELVGIVRSEESLLEMLYNFIICVGQLTNMYVFFDKP